MIVENPIKIDLHIHSNLSSHKDGDKVSFGKKENLEVLIDNLNLNEVNMISITDHDLFDFELYKELKKEEIKNGSIKKVLPGVEFSVKRENVDLHVVAIFDDEDLQKISKIPEILSKDGVTPDYDTEGFFSEEKFNKILKEININSILIAHQKKSPSEKNIGNRDAYQLGEEKLDDLISCGYISALEFSNPKNEVFNKIHSMKMGNNWNYLTGSDCHEWNNYPGSPGYKHTFLKSLPTFMGLRLSLTEKTRISLEDNFFSASEENYFEFIEIKSATKTDKIHLSKGINVIIGDNSIGKSALLSSLNKYGANDIKTDKLDKEYKKFHKQNKISIETSQERNIFNYIKQGGIREKFESGKELNEIFKDKFLMINQENIDNSKSEFRLKMNNIFNLVEKVKSLKEKLLILEPHKLENIETLANEGGIVFSNDKKTDFDIVGDLTRNGNIKDKLQKLITDSKELSNTIDKNEFYKDKYINLKETIDASVVSLEVELANIASENESLISHSELINNVITVSSKFLEEKNSTRTSNSKKIEKTKKNRDSSIDSLVRIFKIEEEIEEILENVRTDFKYSYGLSQENRIYDYNFITKIFADEINEEFLISFTKDALVKDILKKKNFETLDELVELILDGSIVRESFRSTHKEPSDFSIKNEKIEQVYKITYQISSKKTRESHGNNAKIFIDLISKEQMEKGVLIIDQPEDDISQKAISNSVLDNFKTMSTQRQVILVTHNPLFVVDLDADNVIHLSKEEGELKITSGSLEKQDQEEPGKNILDVVIDNLEGGRESIEKRMRVYEE